MGAIILICNFVSALFFRRFVQVWSFGPAERCYRCNETSTNAYEEKRMIVHITARQFVRQQQQFYEISLSLCPFEARSPLPSLLIRRLSVPLESVSAKTAAGLELPRNRARCDRRGIKRWWRVDRLDGKWKNEGRGREEDLDRCVEGPARSIPTIWRCTEQAPNDRTLTHV